MSVGRHTLYFDQILEAAELAVSYVEGMNFETFLADRKTQQAVVLNLIVIGECAARVLQETPEVARAHPAIPWMAMKGMRNRIAHGYFSIDLKIVWSTVKDALPTLIADLRRIAP